MVGDCLVVFALQCGHFAVSMGWPPAAAIRDLLDFWGSGGLREICGRPWPKTGQKRRRSGFPRSWRLFWGNRPPVKFDRMLNGDPVNPVWGPMCPWGPRYGRFGEAGGHFVGWGPVLWVRDRTEKKLSDPKTMLEKNLFFLQFQREPIFVENRAILAPDAPYRGRAH